MLHAKAPDAWYARLPLGGRLATAGLLGAIAALGQAPHEQPLAMLVAITVAFVMVRGMNRFAAAEMGWAFGAGYFGVALFWIVEPFQIDPDRHAWMAPFALLFMSMGLALFWGGAFWLARWLSPRTWPLILTWTAAEVLRAYIFTGFPWASPAQVLVAGVAGQGLAFVGPHGMTLLMMLTAWALSVPLGLRHRRLWRTGQVVLFLGASALLYLPPFAPPAPLSGQWVRLIQPNAAQHLKWQPDLAQHFFDAHLQLTAAPPSGDASPPDLIVWPETAIPWTLDGAGPALVQIAAVAGGRPVALGLLRREENALFNSLAVLDTSGNATQVYDKHHLVPFGEYIPFGNVLGRLGIAGLAQGAGVGFASGAGPRLLDFGVLGRGLPLICYEVVFAHGVNAIAQRPDFLLQITNDAWFGQYAGPQQHLAQARMRAIEQGLPMMRAANTGISAMIDPMGRILASLPLNTAGFLDAPLPSAQMATLYSRIGDGPVILLLVFGMLAARLRRHHRPEFD